MANVVVSALATWNGKALKKAKQDVDVFNKQLKNLARTFGITFSAAAVIGFSKKAVKAFAEDEAAAKSLATQLTNTGNAFRISEVEDYIKALEKTFAVLTDLRAPFQTLLNVTGSVDLAQRSLRSALDISAGTGASLEEVVTALASGIRGQTKGITALNTGIDKNIIATGDMNKIMAELEKKFTGQAAARLDTYAGKMDALRKSADESTKIIGTGLVDALTILSKDNSIQNLSDSMENLATNTANATVALAKLLKQFSDFTESPAFKPALLALAILTKNPKIVVAVMGGIAGSEALGFATKDFSGKNKSLQSANEREGRLGLKFAKEYNYYKKEEIKQIKAKTEIDKLRDKFDLERIGLTAALNAATDEETKLRIRAQLAILDNNEALAKKYNAELEGAKAINTLATSAQLLTLTHTSSAADIKRVIQTMTSATEAYLNSTIGKSIPATAAYAGPQYPNATTAAVVTAALNENMKNIAETTIPSLLEKVRTTVKSGYNIPSPDEFYGKLPSNASTDIARGMAAAPTINVNVEGSILALSEMDNAIQDALLRIYKQNGDLAPAGFIP